MRYFFLDAYFIPKISRDGGELEITSRIAEDPKRFADSTCLYVPSKPCKKALGL